jgi:hypothetical protein
VQDTPYGLDVKIRKAIAGDQTYGNTQAINGANTAAANAAAIRANVLSNIAESKAARASSNFGQFGKNVPNTAESIIQRGGAHGDVRGVPAYEPHHMPADSISPLPTNQGPDIAMEIDDHRLTASWGSSREARTYRQEQAKLIEDANFKAAQQMDIQDVRTKFGNKYDDAIQQMLEYMRRKGD